MTNFDEPDNYSNLSKHAEDDDEEDGIVEYLEIDSEVMDTLQDPNEYFTQVNETHQGQIYVQQNNTNTQQLSLVIQNPSTEYTSLKQISSQQIDDHNGTQTVLWSNNVLNTDDNKTNVRTEYKRKSINNQKNCKTLRKRKIKSDNSSENNSIYVEQPDILMLKTSPTTTTTKGQIQNDSDSLDLFFQSMAQTVMHLPSQIQAKIKMDICNVISMAEIKYCSQDTTSSNNLNTEFMSKN